ncbi:hypothetical protein HOF92_10735, partial [bacterium]|nr:hypothetical protein [bacterium]
MRREKREERRGYGSFSLLWLLVLCLFFTGCLGDPTRELTADGKRKIVFWHAMP